MTSPRYDVAGWCIVIVVATVVGGILGQLVGWLVTN